MITNTGISLHDGIQNTVSLSGCDSVVSHNQYVAQQVAYHSMDYTHCSMTVCFAQNDVESVESSISLCAAVKWILCQRWPLR